MNEMAWSVWKLRTARLDTNQICTLLADISNILASSFRSSVDGKAVRWYVSLRTFSWAASARFLFFFNTGSSAELGDIGEALEAPEYGEGSRISFRDVTIRSKDDACECGIG